jgi:hypothetical protein
MTESTRTNTAARSGRRQNRSGAWKSALLASGLGTVLLGSVWLAKIDPPATDRTSGGQATTVQSNGLIAQPPSSATGSSQPGLRSNSQGSAQSLNSAPTLPQRPVFQRPVTRSRRS